MKTFDILIVGAGHAGAQAAISLRQAGFEGSLAIVGDEPDPPYERPPLSKAYLSGHRTFDSLAIRPALFWSERGVEMILGARVDAVNSQAHAVRLADGRILGYGTLIWAAGGTARTLTYDGLPLRGVHTVRTRSDVDRLMSELPEITRVVVVGGGYIGLEAAAVMTKLGKSVTLLEGLDRVLARVAGEPLSRFYEAYHRNQGVDVRLGVGVEGLEGKGGVVSAVRLSTGERIPADAVIVGIGIIPAITALADAGAVVSNGVEVDQDCRTSLPDVFAIGDCAAQTNTFADGRRIRIESVQNATEQAATVARAIVGQPAKAQVAPWFWSDQYDLKLQTVGLSTGYDQVVIRGDRDAAAFAVVYLRAGRLLALDCVNFPRDFAQGRQILGSSPVMDLERLADASVPLKALASA